MNREVCSGILVAAVCGSLSPSAFAQDAAALAHGLWVWKTATVLAQPRSAEALRDFCRANGITEAYVSFSGATDAGRVADLIAVLHRSQIQVEALLSRPDAAEPGKHRDKLLEEVRGAIDFNRSRPQSRFDGIHLDLEPQQLAENKGAGNLRFLPVLVESYRAVRALAAQDRMAVDADIPNKFLKGDPGERKMLLGALPRFTLMLYELTSPGDGQSTAQKTDQLRKAAQRYLDMAYEGLSGANLARISIALRTPDYGKLLPVMLRSLDEALAANRHYAGWAWHSYNDAVQP